jgi:hypothetical protein
MRRTRLQQGINKSKEKLFQKLLGRPGSLSQVLGRLAENAFRLAGADGPMPGREMPLRLGSEKTLRGDFDA